MSVNIQKIGRGRILGPREDFRRPGQDDEIFSKKGEGRGMLFEKIKQKSFDVRCHESSVDQPYQPSRNQSPSSNQNQFSDNQSNGQNNHHNNNSPSSRNNHYNNGYNNNNSSGYNNRNHSPSNHSSNNCNNNSSSNKRNNNHRQRSSNNTRNHSPSSNHSSNNINNNEQIYHNNNGMKSSGRGRGSLIKMMQDSPYDNIHKQFNSELSSVGHRNGNYGNKNGEGELGGNDDGAFRNGDEGRNGKYKKNVEMSDSGGGEDGDKMEENHRVSPMKLEGQKKNMNSQRGTLGKKIDLMSNYIALRCNTEGIIQYHVTFNPSVDCKFQRIRMLHQHDEFFGGTTAFDGMVLFLPKKLEKEITELVSQRPSDNEDVTLTIKFIKVPNSKDCLQVFNIIFRKIMNKLNMCQIGRNYYLPDEAKNIPQYDLDVWPGYVTSCGAYDAGVMLFMDVSHRVLRCKTALEIMEEIFIKNPSNAQNAIKSALIGKAVITRYNNKLYKVDDVLWEMNPTSVFKLSSGEEISFLEYYQKSYNLKIEDHEQPLLLSYPKEKKNRTGDKNTPTIICLVPELANMTGLTDEMRDDFHMMRELAKYTKLSPTARKDSLMALCKSINNYPSARNELERWGFELDTELYRLEGRKLPMEKIKFCNNEVLAGPEADWGRSVGNNQVINPVDVNEWLFLATKRDSNRAEEFVNAYMRYARDMGIKVRSPNLVYLSNDRTENYITALKRGMHTKLQLVVFLFPSQRGDRYNSVKRLCCIENPVPSQVINVRTISDQRKLRSVTQKIALQINCKLGGTLWGVKIPTKSIMVCGVDVNHDGKGSARRSVLAFVSSMNPECTRWYSKVKVQENSDEMSSCMKVCLVDALKKYHDINHRLPERVVLYRDGVGDGELRMVKDFEVGQLKECMFLSGTEEVRPKLAVIVVQKRINTRLLAFEMNSSDLKNPPPGTVVDHSVTKNEWYDFFIVSQHVRQGTVTPTHFVVVHDELGWSADKVQALTYKMTHLYYNWPGTIRVPAPCQYAHKLAFLVGENLKKEPHPQLNDKLFFL